MKGRPKPKPPDHGPRVLHVCHVCHGTWATYYGTIPKNWRQTDKGLICPRCRR